MSEPRRPLNPYSSFKDDHERRKALLVREIRIVLTALFAAASTSPVIVAAITHYFGKLS